MQDSLSHYLWLSGTVISSVLPCDATGMQSYEEWVSSAGEPLHLLNGNQCSSEILVKTVQQHGSYTTPRHPKARRSEGRRKTAACGRTSGWPDLAATGRVKIYGCSYRWHAENMGDVCCWLVSLVVPIKLWCKKKAMSYHRWADQPDGVGEAAHDHLFSLRLKLSRRRRDNREWMKMLNEKVKKKQKQTNKNAFLRGCDQLFLLQHSLFVNRRSFTKPPGVRGLTFNLLCC